MCDHWVWLEGGSVMGPLWNDWSVAVYLRVIVYRISARGREIVDRNLLYFLVEASGN